MRALDQELFTVAASCRRIRIVAVQALTEALRLRVVHLCIAVGAGLVFMALGLREFNFGSAELKFIADFGLAAIALAGTVLAALLTAQLHFEDLASGVAASLLARALRRFEYLGGRLAGVVALLAFFVMVLGIVLGLILAVRAAQLDVTPVLPWFLFQAVALIWFKVTLVAAMTLLVCSYAGSALFASCMGLMMAVLAHLRSFTHATGWLSVLRLWPDLGAYDAGPLLTAGQELTGSVLLGLVAYWVTYMGLLAGLAAYVFQHREL